MAVRRAREASMSRQRLSGAMKYVLHAEVGADPTELTAGRSSRLDQRAIEGETQHTSQCVLFLTICILKMRNY